MPFYVQLRGPDGALVSGDEPYGDVIAAHADAQAGAKQIVGDALKGGASLRETIRGKAFEIVDDVGKVIAALPFAYLIDGDLKD